MAKYVRLAGHLTSGLKADIDSGWVISGMDVKEVPDERRAPVAYAFVQGLLRKGILEEAGRAEYDEAHPLVDNKPTQKVEVTYEPPRKSELAVQREVRERQAALR